MFFLYIILLASFFANLEIQIEGKEGWANNLPTWKLKKDNLISKIFGGRPITGYHFFLNLFVLAFAHFPYMFISPSIKYELRIISFIILLWVVEDFLWFVFNPNYGLKNFKKEKIWWHEKSWLFIAPGEYYLGVVIGFLLYYFSL